MSISKQVMRSGEQQVLVAPAASGNNVQTLKHRGAVMAERLLGTRTVKQRKEAMVGKI